MRKDKTIVLGGVMAVCAMAVLTLTSCRTGAAQPKTYSLIENGQAKSQIVLAADAGPVEKHAAKELVAYLKKRAGAELTITTIPAKNLYPIYLGAAAKSAPKAPAIDEAVARIKNDGFVLAADDDGLRIVAAKPVGVLYGAYEILKKYADIRWFAPGEEFEYCPKNPGVAIPEQIVVSNPSFKFRHLSFVCSNVTSRTIDSWDWMARNGITITQSKHIYRMFREEMDARGAEIHFGGHVFAYLLSDKLFSERPEYFGLFDGKRLPQDLGDGRGARRQPCTSDPNVATIMAENLDKWLDEAPKGGSYLIGNNDDTQWCQCAACAALDPAEEKEKRFVSTRYYAFVNKIAGIVYKTHPEAELWAWAYQNYQEPPTGVAPDKRLTVSVCVHGRCYRHAMDDPACPSNARFRDILSGWTRFGNSVTVREYDESLQGDPPYLPIEKTFCRDLKYYHQIGLAGFEMTGTPPDGTFGPTWNKLKWREHWRALWQTRYLAARMAWDIDADYDALVEDMGSKYYGAAWPMMKRYRETLTQIYAETPGDIRYGTPEHMIGKCLEKAGAEKTLSDLLDEAEAAAAADPAARKRIALDRKYFQSCWQAAHKEFLKKHQKELLVGARSSKIVIDGKLDEADWKKVDAVADFIVTDGKTAAAPRTFVRTLYDRDNMYFAIEAMEPFPDSMRTMVVAPDGPVWTDDSVELFVAAPDMNGKHGQLVINPRGVIYDAMVSGGPPGDAKFDAKAEAKTVTLKDRWVTEIRVPALAFGREIRNGESWKINIARNRAAIGEPRQSSSWSNGVFHGSDAFRSVVFGDVALLENGDFEDSAAPNRYQKKTAWKFIGDNVPAKWAFHEGQPGTAELVTAGAASGKQCLRVNNGGVHQKLNQEADYRDDLVFRAKVRGKGTLIVAVYRYDRVTGKNLPTQTLKTLNVDTKEWTPIEAVYKCKDDKVLRLAFQVRGEIDIDDVVVTGEINRDVAPAL